MIKTDVKKLHPFPKYALNYFNLFLWRDTDCESKVIYFYTDSARQGNDIRGDLHDPEKWSPWKLTPPFGLINIRFYVRHLTYLHVSGISADNHNGNIECVRKKAVPDSVKKLIKIYFQKIKITGTLPVVIGLRLYLDLHIKKLFRVVKDRQMDSFDTLNPRVICVWGKLKKFSH